MEETKAMQHTAILAAAKEGDVKGVKRQVEVEGAGFVVRCVNGRGGGGWGVERVRVCVY